MRDRDWSIHLIDPETSISELYPPNFEDLLKLARIEKLFVPTHCSETELKQWADICEPYSIAVFLQLPPCSILPQQRSRLRWTLKRSLDRIAAAILIAILSPILIAIAAIVRRDSQGTIFFKQWRVGEQGKLFRIYKFRTMISNAETLHQQVMGTQAGLHKLQNDPRITRCGRWLRKYSLDELPQLFNVVRGEMSLVAPRPWALYDALRISPEGQQRLNALPGITGAWQVEARSTLLDLEQVNHRDLKYLKQWSLREDFRILCLTIPKALSGFGSC